MLATRREDGHPIMCRDRVRRRPVYMSRPRREGKTALGGGQTVPAGLSAVAGLFRGIVRAAILAAVRVRKQTVHIVVPVRPEEETAQVHVDGWEPFVPELLREPGVVRFLPSDAPVAPPAFAQRRRARGGAVRGPRRARLAGERADIIRHARRPLPAQGFAPGALGGHRQSGSARLACGRARRATVQRRSGQVVGRCQGARVTRAGAEGRVPARVPRRRRGHVVWRSSAAILRNGRLQRGPWRGVGGVEWRPRPRGDIGRGPAGMMLL
mmetsp:Transcript_88490/g.235471  ORF Transcript_88490/g.235471 Transcript_88490/m.235471 type:complete len:268 (+) Transcript_88490:79-882(+)